MASMYLEDAISLSYPAWFRPVRKIVRWEPGSQGHLPWVKVGWSMWVMLSLTGTEATQTPGKDTVSVSHTVRPNLLHGKKFTLSKIGEGTLK